MLEVPSSSSRTTKDVADFLGNIESVAVAVGSQKYVVFHLRVNGLTEERFQVNDGFPIRQVPRTGVLKPVFWSFDAIESHFARATIDRDDWSFEPEQNRSPLASMLQ